MISRPIETMQPYRQKSKHLQSHTDHCQNNEFDTPWKEILEANFKDFMAFFLPEAHDGIDWTREHEFLDQELARITREAEIGDRRMDKLVKVWQRDGVERWALIHVEIQGDRKPNFAEGMFTYHYRAHDLQKRPVVSLALLTDDERGWRPSEYRHELWGTGIQFKFNCIKLLDHMESQAELEHSSNPFALVTLAHLHAKRTKHLTEDRYRVKWQLIRSLYQRGFDRQMVINLFRFIDWVLHLPTDADKQLWKEMINFEETQKMPYLSTLERFSIEIGEQIGEKRGRQQEASAMLLTLLGYKFGQIADSVTAQVTGAEKELIEKWSKNLMFATSLDDVFAT
ncbi:MAG: DUF4351 domain-containing protein [Magnetococcus sp. YQC-5]